MLKGLDIRILGVLIALSGIIDLYIILQYPAYKMPFWGRTFDGNIGTIIKLLSPTFHLLMGYGFLRLRKWSFYLAMFYGLFALLSALVNFATFGFGRIRTVFIIFVTLFIIYIYFRRGAFIEHQGISSTH